MCSCSTRFTIFNYQRTIFDRLPMRYSISVILRHNLLSFNRRSDTLTALAVGRQRLTKSPALRAPSRCFVDKFRVHFTISGIFQPKPWVRLSVSCRIWSFHRKICRFVANLVKATGKPFFSINILEQYASDKYYFVFVFCVRPSFDSTIPSFG